MNIEDAIKNLREKNSRRFYIGNTERNRRMYISIFLIEDIGSLNYDKEHLYIRENAKNLGLFTDKEIIEKYKDYNFRLCRIADMCI